MTMKGMMLAGLMAATALGATAPAHAQRGGDDNGWRNRGNGGEMRAQRQEQRQQQRAQWQDRRDDARNAQATVAPQQRDPARVDGGVRWEGRQGPDRQGPDRQERDRDFRNGADIRQPQVVRQPTAPQPGRDWRGNRDDVRDGNRNWGQRSVNGLDRRDIGDGRRDGINRGYTDQRRWNDGNIGNRGYAGRDRLDNRERWSSQRRWDNGWRNDRRYDWQSYRRNYGQVYRTGRYYAPRGWNYGYRQFSVGIFLDSLLYSNTYWLNDPYRYRLPPAYGSLRWVRYYDDALLVDTRDGYVVDVINGFFY